MLKVREKFHSQELNMDEAVTLLTYVSPYTYSGELEEMRGRIEQLEKLVARLASKRVKTLKQLNYLAGYERFVDVGTK